MVLGMVLGVVGARQAWAQGFEPETLCIVKECALPLSLLKNHAQNRSTDPFILLKDSESTSGHSSSDMCACVYRHMCGGEHDGDETRNPEQGARKGPHELLFITFVCSRIVLRKIHKGSSSSWMKPIES
jgi:hypothetical protein